MSGIRVVTDSACDLPQALVDELAIDIVPLTIRFGSEEFVDRRDLTPEQFWSRCQGSAVLPETAAPSPGAFQAAFRRATEDGCAGAVCISLASGLSATYQAAVKGSEDAGLPVRVIDSTSITLGQGIMVLAGARAAAAGKGLEDVAGTVEDLVPRTRVFGALDTLEYLKKGGRIGSGRALLGSMLAVKPILRIQDGTVVEESKQRTRGRALAYLIDNVRAAGQIENLGVLNGAAADLDAFLDMLGELYPRDQIVVGDIGPVIGSHCGPGTIGVTYHTAA